jgi:AraC-like DNA-binding protein
MGAKVDPIKAWREDIGRRFLRLDFKPYGDTPFRASTVAIPIQGLRVVKRAMSPGLTFRDTELISDGNDAFGIQIALSSGVEVRQRGWQQSLGRGDATVLHVGTAGSVGGERAFHVASVLCPRAELSERGVRPETTLGRRVPASSEALRLLRSYLRSLEGAKLADWPQANELVCRHILDLAALVLGEFDRVGESGLGAVAAARLALAFRHIAESFTEPGLSVEVVARRQRVSARYLQRLLERAGTSFTSHLTELRLQKALALLTEPDSGRVVDVAMMAGFNDLSHFNHLFRARFGDTPSGVRGQTRDASPISDWVQKTVRSEGSEPRVSIEFASVDNVACRGKPA